MNAFEKERQETREEIWSFLDLRAGERVLDIGLGYTAYSLKKLIELGGSVTSIDIDLAVLHKHRTPRADFVRCNVSCLPFIEKSFDLALANFTLHEIDTSLHEKTCSELCRVSKRIMIVEPTIGEDAIYRRYQELWTSAMNSMNQIEDYQTMDYWIGLLQKTGAHVASTKKFSYHTRLRGKEAKEYLKTDVDEMRQHRVSEKYIKKINALFEDVIEKGMLSSDVNVIVAQVL